MSRFTTTLVCLLGCYCSWALADEASSECGKHGACGSADEDDTASLLVLRGTFAGDDGSSSSGDGMKIWTPVMDKKEAGRCERDGYPNLVGLVMTGNIYSLSRTSETDAPDVGVARVEQNVSSIFFNQTQDNKFMSLNVHDPVYGQSEYYNCMFSAADILVCTDMEYGTRHLSYKVIRNKNCKVTDLYLTSVHGYTWGVDSTTNGTFAETIVGVGHYTVEDDGNSMDQDDVPSPSLDYKYPTIEGQNYMFAFSELSHSSAEDPSSGIVKPGIERNITIFAQVNLTGQDDENGVFFEMNVDDGADYYFCQYTDTNNILCVHSVQEGRTCQFKADVSFLGGLVLTSGLCFGWRDVLVDTASSQATVSYVSYGVPLRKVHLSAQASAKVSEKSALESNARTKSLHYPQIAGHEYALVNYELLHFESSDTENSTIFDHDQHTRAFFDQVDLDGRHDDEGIFVQMVIDKVAYFLCIYETEETMLCIRSAPENSSGHFVNQYQVKTSWINLRNTATGLGMHMGRGYDTIPEYKSLIEYAIA